MSSVRCLSRRYRHSSDQATRWPAGGGAPRLPITPAMPAPWRHPEGNKAGWRLETIGSGTWRSSWRALVTKKVELRSLKAIQTMKLLPCSSWFVWRRHDQVWGQHLLREERALPKSGDSQINVKKKPRKNWLTPLPNKETTKRYINLLHVFRNAARLPPARLFLPKAHRTNATATARCPGRRGSTLAVRRASSTATVRLRGLREAPRGGRR